MPNHDTGGDAGERPYTVTELAERVGMSVRNIRAHQSRGLLPPPERRGRVAYYGPPHEQVLRRIIDLQNRGYNLAAIAAVVNGGDEETTLQRLVLAPLLAADATVLSRAEMADMFGTTLDDDRLRAALDAGLLHDLGDGRYLMPSRAVLEAARALTEMGMPVLELFDLQLQVTTSTAALARRFVEASWRCALEPFAGSLPPRDDWDAVRQRFDRLRHLTASMLAATFTMTVRRATEHLLAERELPS